MIRTSSCSACRTASMFLYARGDFSRSRGPQLGSRAFPSIPAGHLSHPLAGPSPPCDAPRATGPGASPLPRGCDRRRSGHPTARQHPAAGAPRPLPPPSPDDWHGHTAAPTPHHADTPARLRRLHRARAAAGAGAYQGCAQANRGGQFGSVRKRERRRAPRAAGTSACT